MALIKQGEDQKEIIMESQFHLIPQNSTNIDNHNHIIYCHIISYHILLNFLLVEVLIVKRSQHEPNWGTTIF